MNSQKHFENACRAKGFDPKTVIPDMPLLPESERKGVVAVAKLFLIIDHWNDGHVFDYNNWSEEKWQPYFAMEKNDSNPSGFRLDDADCGHVISGVGPRLSYRTRESAMKGGKELEDLYRDFMKK